MADKLKDMGFATILMIILTGLTTLICYLAQLWGWTDKSWLAGPCVGGVVWVIMLIAILFSDYSYSNGGHHCTGNYNCRCGGGGCD